MSGEFSVVDSEQRAMQARQQYMMLGADVRLFDIPPANLQTWVDDVDGVRLEPHAAYDVGWLELEAAMTSREQNDLPIDERHNPDKLLERATDRWQRIALDAANGAHLRSKAELALGSVYAYKELLDGQLPDYKKMFAHQTEAGRLLLREYDRRHDPELTRDLQNITLMMLLTYYVPQSNIFATLLPPRLDEVGSDLRSDLLTWRLKPGEFSTYLTRIAAQSGAHEAIILLPPDLLGPTKMDGREHPVLRLMLSFPKKWNEGREQFVASRHARIAASIRQVIDVELPKLELDIDPLTELDRAREWYLELPSNYNLRQPDLEALDNCLAAFECAYGQEIDKPRPSTKTSPSDLHLFGWIHAELGMFSEDTQYLERAVQVFDTASKAAEAGGDWPTYCEAEIGKAIAELYAGLQKIEQNPDASADERQAHVDAYKQNLAAIAEGMLNGFQTGEVDEASPHYGLLRATLQRLTTCMVLCSGDNEEFLAVTASPRQQRDSRSSPAVSVYVLPVIDDRYNRFSTGKIRLAAEDWGTLKNGVFTFDLPAMQEAGWFDDLRIAEITADLIRRYDNEQSVNAGHEEQIGDIRDYLFDKASLTLSF